MKTAVTSDKLIEPTSHPPPDVQAVLKKAYPLPQPRFPTRMNTLARAKRRQNFVETECYFPIPDFSDENLLADGRLTGSLHGLVPKNEKAAQEGTLFRQQLGQVDWAEVQTPPVLLKAGVFAERERRTVDGSAAATADVVDGGRFVGGGDGSRASGSGAGQGRGSSGGVLGGDWGWKAGVVAGVAGGVLASVSVAAISGAIKRGVRGDRGYEDISGA